MLVLVIDCSTYILLIKQFEKQNILISEQRQNLHFVFAEKLPICEEQRLERLKSLARANQLRGQTCSINDFSVIKLKIKYGVLKALKYDFSRTMNKFPQLHLDTKKIHLHSHTLEFSNSYQILMLREEEPSLSINNYLTKEGSHLLKITDIKLGFQMIRLKDLYKINQNQEEETTVKAEEFSQSNQENFLKDRKNIVKNISKAFKNWLLNSQPQGNQRTDLNLYLNMAAKAKFNNRYIVDLISSPLKPLFHKFLKENAEQWVNLSKVNDKQSHKEAIREYSKLCEDESALARFKVMKSRRRN